MTVIIFEGNHKHPDGLIKYGEVSINEALQIMRVFTPALAGLLIFQSSSDLKSYMEKLAEVRTMSSKDRQTLVYTIITPGENTPVYNLHGKSLSHPVESDLWYQVSDRVRTLPVPR